MRVVGIDGGELALVDLMYFVTQLSSMTVRTPFAATLQPLIAQRQRDRDHVCATH